MRQPDSRAGAVARPGASSSASTDAPAPAHVVFLRLPDVLSRVPLGKTAWYAAIKAGDAPAPCHAGGAAMWPEHEIDAYAQRLMAARAAGG